MCYKNYFIVFLFIAGAVHGFPKKYAVHSVDLGDTFEYVDQLYQDFLSLGNTTIVGAHNRLNDVRSKTLALEDQTRSTVNAELTAIIGAFLQEIANLEAQATQYGISIADCVGDSRAQINQLPDEALTAVIQCILTPKNNILSQVSNTSNAVDASFNNWITVFSTELQQCKSEAEPLQASCASTLGTEISQVRSSFPLTVNQEVSQVESEYPSLNNEYVKCSTNQVAAVSNEAALIVANVAGCANEMFFTASTTSDSTAPPPPTVAPASS